MKRIGLLKAIYLTSRYPRLSMEQRQALKQERLRRLVSYVRKHSPYFERLYRDIPENAPLSELPPTNKITLMEHFDEWLTDRVVTLDTVQRFMQNPDHIGRKLNNKYLVFTTSGSTGNPSILLADNTVNSVMGAINMLRAYARKEDMKAFLRRGGRTVGIFATNGFYLGNSSVRYRQLQAPWKKRQMVVTSVLNPLAQIVEELNRFQPVMLGGYPTALELLIDEQKQGRLNIFPTIIMTGGEYLSTELRQALSETFSCYVQTTYSCTEGGTIACECIHQHFHVNDDWLIVEPVDRDNRPVPDGVQSDKLLLTNLANFTQPIIRYEVTDRIRMHYKPCPCNNPSPWLEIEGRTDDILTFVGTDGEVKIAPLALYALLKQVHGVARFQLIAHPHNQMELRLVCTEGAPRQEVYEQAAAVLREYLKNNGIGVVKITLSEEPPQPHPKSGKFKHVYQLNE